jgi:hypothetical protein
MIDPIQQAIDLIHKAKELQAYDPAGKAAETYIDSALQSLREYQNPRALEAENERLRLALVVINYHTDADVVISHGSMSQILTVCNETSREALEKK